jgi:ABC-type transporter Mla maintaining outer membrane lipid asymmetry ATPase subunit MlaF
MAELSKEDAMRGASIAVSDLQKRFGKQTVLNGIDLGVVHGETVAVLGRSGTGKSVLLKLLIGLQAADSGSNPHPWPGDDPAWTQAVE